MSNIKEGEFPDDCMRNVHKHDGESYRRSSDKSPIHG